MRWQQFVLHVQERDIDTVEGLLLAAGAASVTLSDAADNPILEPAPGETPVWSDTAVTGLFPDNTDFDPLVQRLHAELCHAETLRYRIESLPDRVWEREWLKDFHPMPFGERLWIYPTDDSTPIDDRIVVRLDPGLAFGTGTHATTALCLEWLDSLRLDGQRMLDYGAGSGVLAIAAVKLGCDTATAMDIDPQAIIACRENASTNGVLDQITILDGPDAVSGPYDVVIANILAGPLIQFAESITSTVSGSGMLALSGVLCEQADEVMAAYAKWIEFDPPVWRQQDGQTWSRLTGKRRAG